MSKNQNKSPIRITKKFAEDIIIMEKCIDLMASCIANFQYHSNNKTDKPGKEEINNIINSFNEKAKAELC